MTTPRPTLLTRALPLLALLALSACGGGDDVPELGTAGSDVWVVRLGDARLSQGELDEAVGGRPGGLDSVTVRNQVIEQWLARELLVQQALDNGLDDDPDVRRRLDAARRATLEAAFLDRHFADNPSEPSETDLTAYFDAQGARLALPEPYLRVWLLRPATDRAQAAAEALEEVVASAIPDSLFSVAAARFSTDADGARALGARFLPLSRFAELDPDLGARVASLETGKVTTLGATGRPFVVAVAERAPAGVVPPLDLLRPELTERLAIQRRKDDAARLIQQLRAEAQARGRLDIR